LHCMVVVGLSTMLPAGLSPLNALRRRCSNDDPISPPACSAQPGDPR
jgi:hypothetical protein